MSVSEQPLEPCVSITNALGAETIARTPDGAEIMIEDDHHLFLCAWTGVVLVSGGRTVAHLSVKGDDFFMLRHLADGSPSTHKLTIESTPPSRLIIHWRGFCKTALREPIAANP